MIIYRERLQIYYDFLSSRRKQIIDNIESITNKFRNFIWDDKIYYVCKEEINEHITTLNKLLIEIQSAEQLLKDTLEKFDEYYKLSGYDVEEKDCFLGGQKLVVVSK